MKPDNKCKITSRGIPFLCIGINTIIFNCRDGAGSIHVDNDNSSDNDFFIIS